MTNPKAVITKDCRQCGEKFSLPQCRDRQKHFCSGQCLSAYRAAIKEGRRRECQSCGAEFYPRAFQIRTAQGKYCSIACRGAGHVGWKHSDESIRKRVESNRGKTARSGPSNKLWRGGHKASVQRRIIDGRAAATTRAYRAANPERVREWDQRRAGRETGRLPKNTIVNLRKLQRGKCAVCWIDLDAGYHVDHIVPLALGGKHERMNIQLLCPTCNVRKAAKHPVDFMQERGLLL